MTVHPVAKHSRDLNFWQLACILGAAMGLPASAVGGALARDYGSGTALVSILVGNLVLWLIGLAIVTMSHQKNNAIENIKSYMGNISGIIASAILISAFLFWYAIQIKGATIELFEHTNNGDYKIWAGVLLGVFVAGLGLGGIRLISWVSVVSFPILVILAFYIAIRSGATVSFEGTWGFSLVGMFTVALTWLPGTVNLPTFFRHACSRGDAFFALSLMTLFHIFFQVFAIFSGVYESSAITGMISNVGGSFFIVAASIFVILLYLCINLVNIYFASAIWDMLFPFYKRISKYAIIGLLGTIIFVLLQSSDLLFQTPLVFFENIITGFISNLGIVLLIDYLISIIVRHRPRAYEKFWSSICWLIGCSTIIVTQALEPSNQTLPIISGINASLLAFLVLVLVEETVWSIRHLD